MNEIFEQTEKKTNKKYSQQANTGRIYCPWAVKHPNNIITIMIMNSYLLISILLYYHSYRNGVSIVIFSFSFSLIKHRTGDIHRWSFCCHCICIWRLISLKFVVIFLLLAVLDAHVMHASSSLRARVCVCFIYTLIALINFPFNVFIDIDFFSLALLCFLCIQVISILISFIFIIIISMNIIIIIISKK